MRIAIGGISHETSTFANTPTTLRDFENDIGLFRGSQIFEQFCGSHTSPNMCIGGFIEAAQIHGFEAVPLLWTFAYPSGLIVRSDYETMKAEFLDRLECAEANAPIDGVLLDLHGAMVIEGIDDGDGDFIASVRQRIGPDRPIMVTQDLHGNHTRQRVVEADAIIGFDTYPHIDMAERGREAATLIVQTLRGEIHPVMALRRIPILWSSACQVTSHQPMQCAIAKIHQMEQRPGIISITLATGFPWADVPEMGASVIVVADGNEALARTVADDIGDWVWEHRHRWHCKPTTVYEALQAGERIGKYPIILADQADNTGGGAPGDSTEVLDTFLKIGLEQALILYIVDPHVADKAHAAGVGARISVAIGGKSDPVQGPPVHMDCEVVALADGAFTYDGPMWSGLSSNMGRSAWLRQDGVSVVVVHAREQPLDTSFVRTLGIDCTAMKYISVKSAVHFRSGFEEFAGSIHSVNARAIHTHDFAQLKYKRCSTDFYPLHRD